MSEIDIIAMIRGVNARRARVSITSPSSQEASIPVVEAGAFQSDSFDADAFQES